MFQERGEEVPTLICFGVTRRSALGKAIAERMMHLPAAKREEAVLHFSPDIPRYHDGKKAPYLRIQVGENTSDWDAIDCGNVYTDIIDVDVISRDGLMAFAPKGISLQWNAFEPNKVYIRVMESEERNALWLVDVFPCYKLPRILAQGEDPEELIGRVAKQLPMFKRLSCICDKCFGHMLAISSFMAHLQGQRHVISVKNYGTGEYNSGCELHDIPSIPPFIPIDFQL